MKKRVKMKWLLTMLVCLGSEVASVGGGISQNYVIYNNDTINLTDVTGMKQGYWIYFGKDKKLPGFADDQIVEEGKYLDNRKDGMWKKYYPNGNLESEITYSNSRPNGYARLFHENGNLKEEGLWQGNKWVGEYKLYHDNGKTMQEFKFNERGKREGTQKYYYPNGQVMIEGEWNEGKEAGSIKEYYEDGKIKSEKFFADGKLDTGSVIEYKKEEVKPLPPPPPGEGIKVEKEEKPMELKPFDGNGYHKLYSKNLQLVKDGVFKNYKLMDGKLYRYDENGILKRIEVYKNGSFVGEAPMEEQ